MSDNSCKIVLVGDPGVGKTCIIQRYTLNKFDPNTESTGAASTYTFKEIYYEEYNKSISFDIWDTAGQEQYRSLANNFYINAAIGILVYDITIRSSFESLQDYWHEQLKSLGEKNIIFGVAGNKSDLVEEEKVTEEEGKKFAESINAVFFLTSCKESVGIDDLFRECGKKYLEVNNLIDNKDQGKEKIVLNKKDINNSKKKGKKRKFC